ncbi:MAG: YraN family protein [Planctomycetota bacterium]
MSGGSAASRRRGQAGGGRRWADPGPRGERIAGRWLRRRGYRVLARGLALRPGEIDLLVETPPGDAVAIVEVKTRERAPSDERLGEGDPFAPEQRVGPAKQRKLEQLGAALLRDPRVAGRGVRFDVVAVELNEPAGAAGWWRSVLRGLRLALEAVGVQPRVVVRHYPDAFRSRR